VLEEAQLTAHEANPFRKGRPAYYIREPLITFYEAFTRREWTRLKHASRDRGSHRAQVLATRPERGATRRRRSPLRLSARIVKIPASQAGELIAAARAERFHPGHGRANATWAAVFTSASDRWPRLAQEAQALAGG
jgi:hypothetical protein